MPWVTNHVPTINSDRTLFSQSNHWKNSLINHEACIELLSKRNITATTTSSSSTNIKFPCQENVQVITFVPKSVKAIAILFFAISKFGDTARHLLQRNHAKKASAKELLWTEKTTIDPTAIGCQQQIPLIAGNSWLQVTTVLVYDPHVAICFCIQRPLQSSLLITIKGRVILHHFRVDNTEVIICGLHPNRSLWAREIMSTLVVNNAE